MFSSLAAKMGDKADLASGTPVSQRSRICPNCRRLNSAEDRVCYHCHARLPGKAALRWRELTATALGDVQPGARFFVILCVLIYAFTAMKGNFSLMGGIPNLVALRWGALFPGMDEPWRYLSAMFIHFGLLHIFFNMMTLNDLGRMLEPRLGSGRFLSAFLITGIVGFIASDLWYTWMGHPALTGGASGGLLGLIGVLVGFLYARRDPMWKQVLGRVLVYAAIFAIALPVNNAAHLGGLVSGMALGYLFGTERQRWARLTPWYNRLAALLVVCSVVSIAASYVSIGAWIERERAAREPDVS